MHNDNLTYFILKF